jgi:hypothetical protein
LRRMGLQFTLGQVLAVIAVIAVFLALGRFSWALVFAFVWIGCHGLANWEAKRGRPRVDRESGDLIFQHGLGVRFLAIGLTVIVAAACVSMAYILLMKNRSDVSPLGIGLGFFFMELLFLWNVMRFSIVVSPGGVGVRSAWRPAFFVAWQEIDEAYYSFARLRFVIRSTRGRTIHVPHGIAGFTNFKGELEKHLDPSGLEKPRSGDIKFNRSPDRSDRFDCLPLATGAPGYEVGVECLPVSVWQHADVSVEREPFGAELGPQLG